MPWRPSRAWGVRAAGVAVAVIALQGLAALVADTSGVDEWARWMHLTLLALSLLALGVSWARSQVESRGHWWLVTAALAGSVFSHLVLSLGWAEWRGDGLTVADAGMLVFYGCFLAFMVRHLRGSTPSAALVHVIDGALLGLAITFFVWELVIAPSGRDLAGYS
ncbi:MAG: hypothetical protein Q7V62_07945, partial [Actinomycetota bacterium]|nr:hypothetical protein [Actinomycetota bacterium]